MKAVGLRRLEPPCVGPVFSGKHGPAWDEDTKHRGPHPRLRASAVVQPPPLQPQPRQTLRRAGRCRPPPHPALQDRDLTRWRLDLGPRAWGTNPPAFIMGEPSTVLTGVLETRLSAQEGRWRERRGLEERPRGPPRQPNTPSHKCIRTPTCTGAPDPTQTPHRHRHLGPLDPRTPHRHRNLGPLDPQTPHRYRYLGPLDPRTPHRPRHLGPPTPRPRTDTGTRTPPDP